MRILLLCLFLLSGCRESKTNQLHLFVWEGYFHPDLIEKFEEHCDCRVIIDTYDSNEAMYAKLKLGQTDYDIIMPSNYIFEVMELQGMLAPINKRDIPNVQYVDRQRMAQMGIPVSDHGIPYLISYTGIGYRKDRVEELVNSWTIFGNPQYRGRMTMLNDPREVIGAALKVLGYSVNTINHDEVAEAVELVIQWKKNLAKFESEQYKNGLATSEYFAVQGEMSDILQVMQEEPEVSFGWPKEGALVSIDYLAIPAGSRHREMAEKFINFFLDPEVEAETVRANLATPLNRAVYPLLDRQDLFPREKVEVIRNLGENLQLYLDAWEEIKTRRY